MKKKIIIPISVVVLIIIFIAGFSMCSSSNSQDYYENNDFSETDGFTEDNEIEDNISSVGNETLQYPSENDEWEYDVYETYITLKKYKGNSKTVNIPSEIENKPVKSIGSKCFNKDDQGVYNDTPPLKEPEFTSIDIPDSIEVIESAAFKGVQISRLVIPKSVYFIDEYAFAYNDKLENITLPDSITVIKQGTFMNCKNLSSFQLPDNLEEIQGGAFEATGLENLIMPDSVAKCGDQVFAYCSKLKNITLSESLITDTNGSEMFKKCSSFTEVHFSGLEAGLNEYDLNGVNIDNLTIYGKSGSKAATSATRLGIKFVLE